MKRIDVSINKARINSFTVNLVLGEKLPEVAASIALYAGEKAITDFRIATDSWNKDLKFDLPAQMVPSILKIAKELEIIVVRHFNSIVGYLPPASSSVIDTSIEEGF